MAAKSKLARTDAEAALFAAGYPHLVKLIDPHPDDAAAAARAERALDAFDPDASVEWSREVATRFVRGLAEVGRLGIGIMSNHRGTKQGKAALAAIAGTGAIDEKRGREIAVAIVSKVHAYDWQGVRATYILEQLIGGEAVLDAMLKYWEKTPASKWDAAQASDVAYALGFVVLRLATGKRAAYVKRMQALAAKGATVKGHSYLAELLDLASGGQAAIARSLAFGRREGAYWLHFTDEPARILACSEEAAQAWKLDAYHVYLAGDGVLANLAKHLRRVPVWRKLQLVEELVPLASKRVDAILKELAKQKPLAAPATAALAIRAGKSPKPATAKPVKRPSDAAIEKQLDALSTWLAAELGRVRGKRAKEKAAIVEAVSRYGAIRDSIGEPPDEAVVHFFAADGCGWKQHREPALLAAEPTAAELARWTALLQDA